MKTRNKIVAQLLLALALTGACAAQAEVRTQLPEPAADIGALAAQAGAESMSVTIALGLENPSDAESLLQAINTPGSAQFHRFLSADEFKARFAPSAAHVAQVIATLARYGLSAEHVRPTTLRVTGAPADMERAFSVSLHRFAVSAHGETPAYTFHAPLGSASIPAELTGLVAGVAGLSSRPTMRPHYFSAPEQLVRADSDAVTDTTGSSVGSLTVTDFANQYDVLPLYLRGVYGTGKTIGILTFASFTPTDAFAYWSAVGISVNQNRLMVIDVDGGPGAPSDTGGSQETTLDVEQAGGIAPQANIMVYQAPNTSQGFVDLLAEAVDDNLADSLSISWGEWELFDNPTYTAVSDPVSGSTVGVTQAIHELLLRAGIQGQSVFTSAGDNGAYEANGDLGCYGPYLATTPKSCSLTLSVDYPASDPAITAAGGTTLPGRQTYCIDSTCAQTVAVNIAHERVWGWDYLDSLCTATGSADQVACGTFGVGGGGGVSILFAAPAYQSGIRGVVASQLRQRFRAGNNLVNTYGVPASYVLPAAFHGRNVPDVSFNADPETGYMVYYTSSKKGGTLGIAKYVGGTSFVAPQLNGVAALLAQATGGQRVGLLNNALYAITPRRQLPGISGMPLHPVEYGDNGFYFGRNGYSPAAGVGTLDVAQFAEYLISQF